MARIPIEKSLVRFNLPPEFSYVRTDDPEFNRALDFILNTSYNLFINGPAGVGKSVLIEIAYKLLNGVVMVIGSTGVSASHLAEDGVPASTIHTGLVMKPLDIFSKEFNSHDKNDLKGRNILSAVDVLLIEEVGMVNASIFDHIGVLIEAAERKRKSPIRVICFGDILQLSPVVKINSNPEVKAYYKTRYRSNEFFFSSDYYSRKRFVPVFLNTIYRQSEGSFQNVLNRIRLNKATHSDLELINTRYCSLETFREENPLSLILAPTVNTVRYLNNKYGTPQGSKKSCTYIAVTSEHFDWKDAGLVEPVVTLWEGQQVMCIHNESGQFQNGTLCKIKQVYEDAVVAEKADGKEILIKKYKWPQYEYKYDAKKGTVKAREKGAVVQIGCKPAVAFTIHKAQGLTLESVYLYLQDGWIPSSGLYLGLSRCKTLEGIGLSRLVFQEDIKVLREPIDFLARNGII